MFSNAVGVANRPEELIEQWIAEAAQNDAAQRRRSFRYPLFRAARIVQGSQEIAGYCREISPRGIGLLHSKPIDVGKAIVAVNLPERDVELTLDVRWTKQFAEDWWISGGRFKTSSICYASLLMSTIRGVADRRRHKRYAFFRQFTVYPSNSQAEHKVCSLDISMGGMSLLSSGCYIEADELRLRTTNADSFVELPGFVVSYRELANGLAIYGIAFKPLTTPLQFEPNAQ